MRVWTFIDTDANKAISITKNTCSNKYGDLERLHKLKESEAITQVEFELEKAKLLK